MVKNDNYGLAYVDGRTHALQSQPSRYYDYPSVQDMPLGSQFVYSLILYLILLGVYFAGWFLYAATLEHFDQSNYWLIFAPVWPVILVGWILYEIFAEFGSESLDFLKECKDFVVALYQALIA